MTATDTARIAAIVDWFIRSEYFENWSAENVESGGYSPEGTDSRDRFDRCYDAAENGADGSTHRERINDMRDAFNDWIRDRRRGHWHTAEPLRVIDAVIDHFNTLEEWHERNGSADQEVG